MRVGILATILAQLAVFLRGINIEFNIAEEFWSVIPMQGTRTGKDLYDKLKSGMNIVKHEGESIGKATSRN